MMIKRFMSKVSDDNAEEGLKNIIGKMLGIDSSEVVLSNEMLSQIAEITKQKQEVKKIINPYFENLKSENSKESNKKMYELIDLGMFIYHLRKGDEIKIIECGEQPDFIISYQDELIGIEHTGIYDDEIIAEISTIKKMLDKCQIKLLENGANFTGLFNIIVSPSKLKEIFPFQESEIIKSINESIIAYEFQSKDFKNPDFITEIFKSNSDTLELALGENYWLSNLDIENLKKSISKKEKKVQTYKNLNKINKCWLLIKMDGTSVSSSFEVTKNMLPSHSSQFDNIFLFDTFKGEINLVKKE